MENKIFILTAVLFLSIGFMIGAAYATQQTVKFCVDIGSKIIKMNGGNISIDQNLITAGLIKYQTNTKSFLNITG